jgi:hypothetical protein
VEYVYYYYYYYHHHHHHHYLTAIELTPGGSSTVHIYTQTVHRILRTDVHNNYKEIKWVKCSLLTYCGFLGWYIFYHHCTEFSQQCSSVRGSRDKSVILSVRCTNARVLTVFYYQKRSGDSSWQGALSSCRSGVCCYQRVVFLFCVHRTGYGGLICGCIPQNVICTAHPIFSGDKIEKNEMGGVCSAYG